MTRDTTITFRVSQELKEKAQMVAEERGVSLSEMIVDYLKRLPNPKGK